MRFLRHYGVELALVTALGLAVLFFGYLAVGLLPANQEVAEFSGARALEDAGRQMAFGARATGTQSSRQMGDWLVQQLKGLGWDVVNQEFRINESLTGRNIVAIRSPRNAGAAPPLLLATHYDTRIAADDDPTEANRTLPDPGANHGASGVAVLLELARTLDIEAAQRTVCLAFFDADANTGLPGWERRYGSVHFAQTFAVDIPRCTPPSAVVALDLVGAESPVFAVDPASDPVLTNSVWTTAAELGNESVFVPQWADRESVNSHTPFAGQGFPTTLILDSAYAHSSTLADTLDRLRAATLEQVGRTLKAWVEDGGDR